MISTIAEIRVPSESLSNEQERIDKLRRQVETLPQLSEKTLSILRKHLEEPDSPDLFSKQVFNRKIYQLQDSMNLLNNRLEHKRGDQCLSIVSGAWVTGCCLSSFAVPIALHASAYVKIFSIMSGAFCYLATAAGFTNCLRDDMYRRTQERQDRENLTKSAESIAEAPLQQMQQITCCENIERIIDEDPIRSSLCCLPYIACYQAIRIVPYRIELASNNFENKKEVYSEFNNLVSFCKNDQKVTLLFNRLKNKKIHLNTLLAIHAGREKEFFNSSVQKKFSSSNKIVTNGFLQIEKNFSENKTRLEQELRDNQIAMITLKKLIDQVKIIALNIVRPASIVNTFEKIDELL